MINLGLRCFWETQSCLVKSISLKVCINSTSNKNKNLRKKYTLACICYVIGRIRGRYVSYALQQISYHTHAKTVYYMHPKRMRIIWTPKSIFVYQYHKFSFLFGVLFICILIPVLVKPLLLKYKMCSDCLAGPVDCVWWTVCSGNDTLLIIITTLFSHA